MIFSVNSDHVYSKVSVHTVMDCYGVKNNKLLTQSCFLLGVLELQNFSMFRLSANSVWSGHWKLFCKQISRMTCCVNNEIKINRRRKWLFVDFFCQVGSQFLRFLALFSLYKMTSELIVLQWHLKVNNEWETLDWRIELRAIYSTEAFMFDL